MQYYEHPTISTRSQIDFVAWTNFASEPQRVNVEICVKSMEIPEISDLLVSRLRS